MEFRNPAYNARGTIDCEVLHPSMGWVPFTASPDDQEAQGREVYADIMEAGGIADYVPPSDDDVLALARAEAVLTRATFCSALHATGVLPVSEAVEAAKGNWPATFAEFTAAMSEADAADAQIRWAAATSIHYADDLLQQLALAHADGDQATATATLDAVFNLGGL
ncbi:MAG: hypothetical protein CML60_10500 [Rhodobacteraceae bacterium]|nr:hypothetical protein [Paracoccaceae bacterium]MBT26807.1 hypothetical protein [Paracoccaceae bacterium]